MTKYVLIDTNEYFYNCGHYPHWEVKEQEGPINFNNTNSRGVPLEYPDYETAIKTAERLNAHSSAAWRAFLNS